MKLKTLIPTLLFPLIIALPKLADGQVSHDPYANYGNQGGSIAYSAKMFDGRLKENYGALSGASVSYWKGGDLMRFAVTAEYNWKTTDNNKLIAASLGGELSLNIVGLSKKEGLRAEVYIGPKTTIVTEMKNHVSENASRQNTNSITIETGLELSKQITNRLSAYVKGGYQTEIKDLRYVEDATKNTNYEPTNLSGVIFNMGIKWNMNLRDKDRNNGSDIDQQPKPLRDPFTQP